MTSSRISSFSSEILLLFCWCTSFDTIKFCDLFNLERFLFLKIILIYLKFSFQIISSMIFQKIVFDSRFSLYKLSLCHRHKKKLFTYWRINNLFLKSIANLNFSKSWLDFDIKKSRFVLIHIKFYSIFNNNQIEKIRLSIYCIIFH
jgi:hypothetical protein